MYATHAELRISKLICQLGIDNDHARQACQACSRLQCLLVLLTLILSGANYVQVCAYPAAPLPPELLDMGPEEFVDRSASDGTIEENFEEELATAPEVYSEVRWL